MANSDIPFLLLLGSGTGANTDTLHKGLLLLLGNTPPSVAISSTDLATIVASEGSSGDFVSVSSTDTLTVVGNDGTTIISTTVSTTDSSTVTVSESATILASLSSTDSDTVTVTESVDLVAISSSTDTAMISGTEGVSDVQDTVYVSGTDTSTITGTDSSDTVDVSVTTTDIVVITGNDGYTTDIVSVSSSDSMILVTTETTVTTASFTATDDCILEISYGSEYDLVAFSATESAVVVFTETSSVYRTYVDGPPPDEIVAAALGPYTRITRHVDIYESDGVTPFMLEAPFTDGSVNVDSTRNERRTLSLKLYNDDGALTIYPDGFWYDKIIKVYRGVRTSTTQYERQIGEFYIDQATEPHFPHEITITGRDGTKKMLQSKFQQATGFAMNTPIENIIEALALNSGIPSGKIDLPLTGISAARDFFYERGTERWAAAKEVANSYGYDIYFTHDGTLTITVFADPTLGQPEFEFVTGSTGSIASYEKHTSDSLLFNHVIVTGESADTLPVWSEAKNEISGHPTSIARLGDKSWFYTSAFITTEAQALEVAQKFLRVSALEQFDVSIESIVLPWLDAGTIVDFIDPNPGAGDPTRYLLSSMEIPLLLKPMSSVVKRVTAVL